MELRLDVGFWFVVADLAGDVSYVLLLLLFGVVVVGEGVDSCTLVVGSGVDHKSLLLLMMLVVCMGGEGVRVLVLVSCLVVMAPPIGPL